MPSSIVFLRVPSPSSSASKNSAARVVHRSRESDHITPILHELHWLPVSEADHFQGSDNDLPSRARHGPGQYLRFGEALCACKKPVVSNWQLTVCAYLQIKSFGDRHFAYATSTLWNSLPLEIRTARTLNLNRSQRHASLPKPLWHDFF